MCIGETYSLPRSSLSAEWRSSMAQQDNAATYAAIDVGSNSIEMAIANCAPDRLEIIQDESTMLRLGESVKTTGDITQEMQDRLLTILHRYLDQAKQHGADPILAVATEAMREAHNSQTVLATI